MSWAIIAAGTLLRLLVAAALGLGLTGRLVPTLVVGVAGLALVGVARLVHDEPAAVRTATLWLLLPLFTNAALTGTGPALLLAATSAMTWAVAWAIERPVLPRWILSGAACGVAMALDLVAFAMVAGIAFSGWRVHTVRRMLLRTPGPWVSLGVSIAVAAWLRPRLALSTPADGLPERLVDLALLLLLLVTPLVVALVLRAIYVTKHTGARPSRGVLAGMSVIGLIGTGLLVLLWPVAPTAALLPFVPGLVVLTTSSLPERSRWWRPALAIALLGAVAHAALALRAA